MKQSLFIRSLASLTFIALVLSSSSSAFTRDSRPYGKKHGHLNSARQNEGSEGGADVPAAAPSSSIDGGASSIFLPPSASTSGISLPVDSVANPSGQGESVGNDATSTNFSGQFWAGADIGTLPRAEALPGRVFYDYDGKTVKDPVKTLADAGVNAMRIETDRKMCLGPTTWNNTSNNLFADEMNYKLDFGCIDMQVNVTQRAVAEGMRVVLVINQGRDIPKELESATYAQMIDNIQQETKRQLQPFLDVKILPDIILFENEGTDGFLFNELDTGHARGIKNDQISTEKLNKERCGQLPTGNIASWPQLAGYYKAEILACNEAITAAGYSPSNVRYGLHSHAQYVDWKEGLVHGGHGPSETQLLDADNNPCPNSASVIPQTLLSLNVSTLLNIAGFSAYPTPMTPTDINSPAAQAAILDRPLKSISLLQSCAERYGKFTDGPFAGQYKLQSLGVEWATRYDVNSTPQEQALTEMMWQKVKQFDSFMGMMWWEPWYCYTNWEGGDAALCKRLRKGEEMGEAPTEMLKTWGQAAVSPWRG